MGQQIFVAWIQLLISLEAQPIAVTEGLLGDQARAIQFPVIPQDRPLQEVKVCRNCDEVIPTFVRDHVYL